MNTSVLIPDAWQKILSPDVIKKSQTIENSIEHHERLLGATIYPPKHLRYQALNLLKPDDVKVVIIGQDPYHGEGEAMGLSFSIPKTQRPIPSSLRNIYNELHDDIGFVIPKHGCLEEWVGQGVLLLNRYLSVKKDEPNSHRYLDWQIVTNEIIRQLSVLHKDKIVFVLLGKAAATVESELDLTSSLIIKTSHPSSLGAAYKKGFQGSRIFSRINQHLIECGLTPIDWTITD